MLRYETMLKSTFHNIGEKIFLAEVKLRQQVYKHRTSYPFLSGDAIAQACDVIAYSEEEVSPKEISQAKSIFCPSERLEEFLIDYKQFINAEILVLGNTDRDFYELEIEFPKTIKVVHLQNSHISDNFFKSLPIGLENIRYGRNGLPSLFHRRLIANEKENSILVGPFSPTHKERLELNTWQDLDDSRITYISQNLKPKKLTEIASKYKFVACPRGNGTDTHRFWETLYRGSIPVVKESAWSRSIAELGLPLIQLSDWSFEEFLNRISEFEHYKFDPKHLDILWMPYWEKLLNP
jgi:hypothetical protein